jgi:tRNA threonylcarbamoyladenosine biosynthesis protein TsaB
VLAIDTAFDICSVALVTPDFSDIRGSHKARKHADDVLPMIDNLFSTHQMRLASLDVLAMVSGPGSFTGLRIGTAVVQGLAFGADLPVAAVSSLAMIARSARHNCKSHALFLVCLHARENQFYFAAYHDSLAEAPRALIFDTIFTPQQIEQSVSSLFSASKLDMGCPCIMAGIGWHNDLLAHIVTNSGCQTIAVAVDALVLAELAAQDYKEGKVLDASDATPAYLNNDLEYRTA